MSKWSRARPSGHIPTFSSGRIEASLVVEIARGRQLVQVELVEAVVEQEVDGLGPQPAAPSIAAQPVGDVTTSVATAVDAGVVSGRMGPTRRTG